MIHDMFEQALSFKQKLKDGQLCMGVCITFSDPTVSEALCPDVDYLWIDMEHGALTIESVQGHILAAKSYDTAPIVRVPWNDPVLVKPVLDAGAAGVIIPMVRSADDVARAVASTLYPPAGERGYGPKRPGEHGRRSGKEFCRAANDAMIVIVQIEHKDAVECIDEIVAVPGLTAVVVGPNDLSSSMGYTGEPRHPNVLETIGHVFDRANAAGVPPGIAVGTDPSILSEWADRGAKWLTMGADFLLLTRAAGEITGAVRGRPGC